MIDNLIRKLKESVTTVGDLTKLLEKLPSNIDAEWYYEKSAENQL